MEIWFVRHGQSTVNAGEPSSDTATVKLTPKGWGEAENFANSVPQKPDVIAVTPYLRTQETSQPTQDRFPNVPVVMLPLHEFSPLSFTHYAQKTTDERMPLMKAYWDKADVDAVDGEGAESFAQMVRRIETSLQRLKEDPGSFKIAFTHGRILQTLRVMLTFPDLNMQDLMRLSSAITQRAHIDNCAVFKTRLDDKGVLHLAEEDRAFVVRMRAEIEGAAKPPRPQMPPLRPAI